MRIIFQGGGDYDTEGADLERLAGLLAVRMRLTEYQCLMLWSALSEWTFGGTDYRDQASVAQDQGSFPESATGQLLQYIIREGFAVVAYDWSGALSLQVSRVGYLEDFGISHLQRSIQWIIPARDLMRMTADDIPTIGEEILEPFRRAARKEGG